MTSTDRCPICGTPFGAHRQTQPGVFVLCDGQRIAEQVEHTDKEASEGA